MFTGIVEALARVVALEDQPPARRMTLEAPAIAADVVIGDSVAVNGCCLTAIEVDDSTMTFEAGPETLSRTNLGLLTLASAVNVERSLRVSDRLGGHIVTGHVDAIGWLERRDDQADWSTCWFRMPAYLGLQMVPKGSIAIDGVSLTLVDVETERFSVALIPHTLKHTTLGQLAPGGRVNLETDLLAKYVQKQLQAQSPNP